MRCAILHPFCILPLLVSVSACSGGGSGKADTAAAEADADTDADTDADSDADADTDADTDADSDADTDADSDAPVVLNELQAGDTAGGPDWVELLNTGADSVDLSDWVLTDTAATGGPALTLPAGTALAAGARLLIWCDDGAGTEPGPHAPFKLSGTGETLTLQDAAGATVDETTFPALEDDTVWARSPDGGPTWTVLSTPTPDAANPG